MAVTLFRISLPETHIRFTSVSYELLPKRNLTELKSSLKAQQKGETFTDRGCNHICPRVWTYNQISSLRALRFSRRPTLIITFFSSPGCVEISSKRIQIHQKICQQSERIFNYLISISPNECWCTFDCCTFKTRAQVKLIAASSTNMWRINLCTVYRPVACRGSRNLVKRIEPQGRSHLFLLMSSVKGAMLNLCYRPTVYLRCL